ncbi:glycogen/starch/alpha-glucan phosphorylase [Sulfurivermis fontis]|uniref:glycogen/starch/alpha-glucan phosphorylase n=1 Tax=Sulfurivermis fontis TaxID=1972068 RepID=UPI000FD81AD0|nr:glycogen/starch/alpha-glucan phosphorylase [Sulfurivermis fontis]
MPSKPSSQSFKYDYQGLDAASLKHSLANRMIFTVGKDSYTATDRDWFHSLAYAVRDRLIERWMETMRSYYTADAKRIYYLSMEFLIGRTLTNSLLNLGFYEECARALQELGLDLEEVVELEYDAALGNGGLGRLAACFLDSMATLRLPGYGYGIRYEYGMFRQSIENGRQVEHPDNWLRYGNPWEFPRPEVLYPIKFGGHVVEYPNERGELRHRWIDTDQVMAMAYDTPIPGYGVDTVNNLRLWSAKATRDFELKYFNEGNYIKAVEDKTRSENLSKVLYPADTTTVGRELRLMQQYFFVSASLQDILYRYRKVHGNFDLLADKVAIQLNDTHPSIAIPELMRILLDVHHLSWDKAWALTVDTFAYTNHTLLPEALETWPVAMFEELLPRHLQIIYEINHRFLQDVMHKNPGDVDLLRRMSLIDESGERRIRMAHLAIVGSHRVNGVAAVHSQLMRDTIFADFHRHFPDKFINITNGITPRLWLNQSNRGLSALISKHIGEEWKTDLEQLRRLEPLAEDAAFRAEFSAVKRANKARLAARIGQQIGVEVNVDSLFDVQIKRIHEYKRQLLNVLHVITLYNRIRRNPDLDTVPRTVIFGGKAAPGYTAAKRIIHLINAVADIVNHDPQVHGLLKVVFLPNYDVSSAGAIIPAADLSEQISTAGTEASGTGNMKLALNGALTIGTLDGANIEIREAVGEDNIFIFGLDVPQMKEIRARGHNPWDYYHGNDELREVLDMIGNGYFSPDAPDRFRPTVEALLQGGDHYLLLADYASYVQCQERVAELYRDSEEWTRRAILNVARMGRFSSDRTIGEYASQVWDVKPVSG